MAIKTFNIDEQTYAKFLAFCRDKGVSMSKQLEMFMKIQIKEKKFLMKETAAEYVTETIAVSEGLVEELDKLKMHKRETYEDIIWDLIEDTKELSEETKRDIAIAEKEIAEGKTISFEEVKKKMLNHVRH